MSDFKIIKETRANLKGKFVRYTNVESSDKYMLKEAAKINNLLIVAADDGDYVTVGFKYENATYSETFTFENFEKSFRIEPDNIIDLELQVLMTDALSIKGEMESLTSQLNNYQQMNQGGDIPNSPAFQNQTGQNIDDSNQAELNLISVSDLNPITLARTVGSKVAHLRDEFELKQEKLQIFRKKIEAFQLLKLYQMELMLKIKSQLEKIENILTTINLYLGSNEQIVQLRQGKWAKKDEKLHIRQLTLFADEESMIALEEGGMDFKYLEDFDNWLLANEKHIRQIVPEEKCIVAIKPRRKRKDYGSDNPFFEAKMESRNKQTYILIRHGANLFRVAPEWAVGERLFPTQKEMDQHFVTSVYNHKISKSETRRVTPEDHSYSDCLKRFNEANLHYRNSLVLIQGIIDRTGIFADLQERGVNLLWQESFRDEVILINDGDDSRLLSTGKETFAEYQKRLNAQLEVGHRIILGSLYGINNDRYFPKWSSTAPDTDEIYTLEKSSKFDFLIRYKNEHTYSDSTRRASLAIAESDKFYLAYDLATAAEMNHFLHDRLSRSEYLNMIPLIKRIKTLKEAEEKAEEPFCLMLAAQLMQLDSVLLQSEAMEKGRELLKFFKFRNKVHRAVLGNETKALKQIITEYKKLLVDGEIKHDLSGIMTDETLLILSKKRQIWRFDKGDELGVLLKKTVFSLKKGEWIAERPAEEMIFDDDMPKSGILFEHPDWQKWAFGKSLKKAVFWRKDEIDRSIRDFERLYGKVLETLPDNINAQSARDYQIIESFPLAVSFPAWSKTFEIWVYHQKHQFASMACQIHSEIYKFRFREKRGIIERVDKWSCPSIEIDKALEMLEASEGNITQWFPKSERDKFGLIERKNVERLKKAEEKAEVFNQKVAVLFNQVSNRMKDLKVHYNKILENEAIEIYKNNFGNMLNWESYRKKAGIKFIKDTEINALENVFRYVYSDTEMFSRSLIVGKTMEELKVFWNSLALKRESSREHIYWNSSYYEKLEFPERFLVLDKSFVLFPLPTETEAEKKEEG